MDMETISGRPSRVLQNCLHDVPTSFSARDMGDAVTNAVE